MPTSSYKIEYIKCFEDFSRIHAKKGVGTYWFRGHENKDYQLVPSIYRKTPTLCSVNKCEERLRTHFIARTLHMMGNQRPINDMEWLSVMQHYRLATRLLDWTERAEVAFLFAVEKYFMHEKHNRDILPCVWVLKPLGLNGYYELDHIPNLSTMCSSRWLNEDKRKDTLKLIDERYFSGLTGCKDYYPPVAVFHPLNNERIRAQSGVFTLFPLYKNDDNVCNHPKSPCKDVLKIDGVNKVYDGAMEKLDRCKEFLTKYIIVNPEHMYRDLISMGIKRSVIYPEMDVFSTEIEDFELGNIKYPVVSTDYFQ